MTKTHVPVLAGELIELLDPQPGEVAVDCTFGAGGHARLIADRLGPTGTLIAIDRDPAARERFDELAAEVACRTRFLRASFADGLRELARRGPARGPRLPRPRHVLDAGRHARARLLLRLRRPARHAHGPRPGARRARAGRRRGTSGAWPALFRDYGEERFAGPIARAIVRARGRAADRHDPRARRRHRRRDPGAGPLRRRPSRQARLPGDPHRGQRRARPARRGAAAGLGRPAPRTAALQGSPSTRSKTGA